MRLPIFVDVQAADQSVEMFLIEGLAWIVPGRGVAGDVPDRGAAGKTRARGV